MTNCSVGETGKNNPRTEITGRRYTTRAHFSVLQPLGNARISVAFFHFTPSAVKVKAGVTHTKKRLNPVSDSSTTRVFLSLTLHSSATNLESMRIGQFVRLAAFFAAVAGEICQK